MIQTLPNDLSKSNEKKVQLKKTMFAGFRPIFCFSRIIGLMPFSIVCDSNGEVQSCKVKRVDCVWFTISFCTHLTLAFLNYRLMDLSAEHHPQIANLFLCALNSILTMLSFICCSVFYVMNMCNRHKFFGILQNLGQFDKEVRVN